MPILTSREPEHDLTVHRVIGICRTVEVEAALREFMQFRPTLNDIWDATGGRVQLLTPGDLQRLVDMASVKMTWRKGGRSAAVLPGALHYGIGRMLEPITRLAGLVYEYRTFDNYLAARAWVLCEGEADAGKR